MIVMQMFDSSAPAVAACCDCQSPPGLKSVLHCEPLFARKRPAGNYSSLETANMKQRHLFGSRARASLPGCVDIQHGSLSSRSATPSESFQVASKELESSKQQLVAEACSYGSGKHREFVLLRLTRGGKRPVYSSCKVPRT